MSNFWLGKVIEKFTYNFDGEVMEVTKFHPRISEGCTITKKIDEDKIMYHCEELHEHCSSLQYMILSWITYKNLGHNNGALTSGISKALEIKIPY
jgi:hypothetical protein